MKSFWAYRVLFFGCIALSMALVAVTIAGRQRGPVRAEGRAEQAAAPRLAGPAAAGRPREAPAGQPLLGSSEGTAALTSRVRITTVIPFRREIHLHNFGDAAQDLSGWALASPRPGGDDRYSLPIGTVLLPGESLIVAVEEGVDGPNLLHWRAPADNRVLELTGDTVVLLDDLDSEVSRFTYLRR